MSRHVQLVANRVIFETGIVVSDVVVIGAGAAGMTAARALNASGVNVMVLEARARVGGRTWSEPLANGHIAERGGEYFDSSMSDVHELARELGLHMTTQGFNPTVRQTADPNGPSLEDLETAAKVFAGYWESLGEIAHDVSIADILKAAPLERELATVIGARLSSGRAANVSRVSARWSEGGFQTPLVSHEHNTRIAEGNQSLSQRMAYELGHERLKLRWPVAAIDQDQRGCVITSMLGETIRADIIVIAVPVSILKRLRVGGLDARTRLAIAKVGFGQATKLHLTVDGDCAPGIKQEVSTPFSTWATAGLGSNRAAFVTGFGSTHETQAKLSVDAGPHVFRSLLEAQWPGVQFGPDSLLTYWGGDPWTRGAYSYRPVGWTAEDDEYLAAPSGRLFFAGEHTADIHRSAICGAIRSGKRAAMEVVEALS
jgi:monoamine oxidase